MKGNVPKTEQIPTHSNCRNTALLACGQEGAAQAVALIGHEGQAFSGGVDMTAHPPENREPHIIGFTASEWRLFEETAGILGVEPAELVRKFAIVAIASVRSRIGRVQESATLTLEPTEAAVGQLSDLFATLASRGV
jgi:hypothetical protein